MSIPKCNSDLHIIRKLSDLPNVSDGLTAEALKDKFDEGALALQAWINDTLVPSLTAAQLPFAPSGEIGAENVQDAIALVHSQVRDAASGTIVNGAVTKEKLSAGLLERVYGGRVWVSLDTPGAADSKAADLPVGQLWLRPGFTVENAAGSWVGSGCTVKQEDDVTTVTGDETSATVTVSQSLSGIGQAGDRVYVLFDIRDRDPQLESLTLTLNGRGAQTVGAGGVYSAELGTGGSLTVLLRGEFSGLSAAGGNFQIGNFAVVNADAIGRQNPDARDMTDWGGYLAGLVPLTVYRSAPMLWIHRENGSWWPFAQQVLPVSRGGTGLDTAAPGQLLMGGETDALQPLEPGQEASFLQMAGGKPVWTDKEGTVASLGALRMASGAYVGTGEARSLSLPVMPKLLVISPDEGPVEDRNSYRLWDNPMVLRNGSTVAQMGNGRASGNEVWEDTVSLSEQTVQFSAQSGNRRGVSYGWVAIY